MTELPLDSGAQAYFRAVPDLEALVVDNPELERLEELLDPFNTFEAVGAVHQEVRHSDFLSFLLNPRQNHGLADAFLKRFLQRALQAADGPVSLAVSPIDFDIWDLDEVEIRREWQSIDILILDHGHHLAVVVENKIHASEHGDQLARYWISISTYFPGWSSFGIYLSLSGEPPSDERYIALGYETVCRLIESLVESRTGSIGLEVRTLMLHYAQMLRRRFLEDTEVAELIRRIYHKHQRALDLIFEHRPDQQAEIRDLIYDLIDSNSHFVRDDSNKRYIRFAPAKWDLAPAQLSGKGWTHTGRLLLFEFVNEPTRLSLKLTIGPGPEDARARLFEMARGKPEVFKTTQKMLGRMWNTILQRNLLTKSQLENADMESIKEHLTQDWERLVNAIAPEVDRCLREDGWLEPNEFEAG